MKLTLANLMKEGPVLGDGGYLIELERRGYWREGKAMERRGRELVREGQRREHRR